jgi:NAD(P)-dependent dehydrogenase (short-subunit alcohol dehydrogenase family)
MGLLDGKVALVTGGESGIGRAVAVAYAREGASVMVVDLKAAADGGCVAEIGVDGGGASFFQADVGDPKACAAMVAEAVKKYGRLDIACNNAGVGGASQTTADYPPDAWDHVIKVNLSGVFHCMQAELAEMKKLGGGAIVNMASILGQVGFAQAPAYVAAKHGVVGLTKAAALEVAAHGIRINAVGPGFIKTPMLDPLLAEPAVLAGLIALHPMGRLGESEEVADLVAFLSSSKASFITGAYIPVDGGYLAR